MLSTVKVLLGPAEGAKLPAASDAVPAATEMPKVPSPVTPDRVTVAQAVPDPLTDTLALAVPVVFSEMFPATRVLAAKLASA